MLEDLILGLHELQLLFDVSEHLDRRRGFLPQLVQFLVPLLDLLVQCLVVLCCI